MKRCLDDKCAIEFSYFLKKHVVETIAKITKTVPFPKVKSFWTSCLFITLLRDMISRRYVIARLTITSSVFYHLVWNDVCLGHPSQALFAMSLSLRWTIYSIRLCIDQFLRYYLKRKCWPNIIAMSVLDIFVISPEYWTQHFRTKVHILFRSHPFTAIS
jgi:hypothetical protein